jgi:hypothetical protein
MLIEPPQLDALPLPSLSQPPAMSAAKIASRTAIKVARPSFGSYDSASAPFATRERRGDWCARSFATLMSVPPAAEDGASVANKNRSPKRLLRADVGEKRRAGLRLGNAASSWRRDRAPALGVGTG